MRKILLLSILMFLGMIGYSQKIVSVSNPLEKFFQENYDSTIIYYLNSGSKKNKKYHTFSIKGEMLYYCLYDSVYLSDGNKTYNSLKHFNKNYKGGDSYSYLTISDSINLKNSFWSEIQELQLWNTLDDKNDLKSEFYKKKKFKSKEERQFNKIMYNLRKGEKHIFTLITNDKIINKKFNELFIINYFDETKTRKMISDLILKINMFFFHQLGFDRNLDLKE
jgi:hypothetical protein